MKSARALICLVLAFAFAGEAVAKKDFKGLFGSYRREKFTENEARSTDFGVDLMLSTLLPLMPIVKSSEDPTRQSSGEPMSYSTFFNFETTFFFTLMYHWQFFANIGYYTYEARKENTTRTDPSLPLFHQFEMDAIPLIGGVKYRFGTDDIVPYVGAGVGVAYVRRKGSYDYNDQQFNEEFLNALCGQIIFGIEFYFSARAGIRLETSAHYFKLPAKTFDTLGTPGNFPIILYQGNPWSMRYASGLFFLF